MELFEKICLGLKDSEKTKLLNIIMECKWQKCIFKTLKNTNICLLLFLLPLFFFCFALEPTVFWNCNCETKQQSVMLRYWWIPAPTEVAQWGFVKHILRIIPLFIYRFMYYKSSSEPESRNKSWIRIFAIIKEIVYIHVDLYTGK